jgi:hypothetical protein
VDDLIAFPPGYRFVDPTHGPMTVHAVNKRDQFRGGGAVYIVKDLDDRRLYATHEYIHNCPRLEPVDKVQAWTTCPRCLTSLHHLFGEIHREHTGQAVRVGEIVGPDAAQVVADMSAPIEIETRVVRRELLSVQIDRECRTCGHRWREEIGREPARG